MTFKMVLNKMVTGCLTVALGFMLSSGGSASFAQTLSSDLGPMPDHGVLMGDDPVTPIVVRSVAPVVCASPLTLNSTGDGCVSTGVGSCSGGRVLSGSGTSSACDCPATFPIWNSGAGVCEAPCAPTYPTSCSGTTLNTTDSCTGAITASASNSPSCGYVAPCTPTFPASCSGTTLNTTNSCTGAITASTSNSPSCGYVAPCTPTYPTSCSGTTLNTTNSCTGAITASTLNSPSCGYVEHCVPSLETSCSICSSVPSASSTDSCANKAGVTGYAIPLANTVGTVTFKTETNISCTDTFGAVISTNGSIACSVPSSLAPCGGSDQTWPPGCAWTVPQTPAGIYWSGNNTSAGYSGTLSGTCNSAGTGAWEGVTVTCTATSCTPTFPTSCSGTTLNTTNSCTGAITASASNSPSCGYAAPCTPTYPTSCSGTTLNTTNSCTGAITASTSNSPSCGYVAPCVSSSLQGTASCSSLAGVLGYGIPLANTDGTVAFSLEGSSCKANYGGVLSTNGATACTVPAPIACVSKTLTTIVPGKWDVSASCVDGSPSTVIINVSVTAAEQFHGGYYNSDYLVRPVQFTIGQSATITTPYMAVRYPGDLREPWISAVLSYDGANTVVIKAGFGTFGTSMTTSGAGGAGWLTWGTAACFDESLPYSSCAYGSEQEYGAAELNNYVPGTLRWGSVEQQPPQEPPAVMWRGWVDEYGVQQTITFR